MQQPDIDWVAYKEKKLITILVGWDAKEDDKDVPLNESNIFRLHPAIAETALSAFDRLTLMTEDDRKN